MLFVPDIKSKINVRNSQISNRGICPEMFGCGYDKTEAFQKELIKYRNIVE